MTNVVPLVSGSPADQAAAWIARIDRGPLTPAERIEIDAWLRADPCHRHLLDEHARAWALAAGCNREVEKSPSTSRRAALRAMAASLAVAVVGGSLLWPRSSYAESFATRTGETRTVALPDGSRVILNTGSKVEVSFDGRARSIELVEGEALFEVAHEAERPFTVKAGTTAIRAVGTRFAVRVVGSAEISVFVAEGKVQVREDAPGATDASPTFSVGAGQRAIGRARASVRVERVSPDLVERATGWSRGGVAFREERLGDVLTEINRYTTEPVRLGDPTLADMRVSGYFAIGQTAAFVSGIASGAGLSVWRRADGSVTLSRT